MKCGGAVLLLMYYLAFVQAELYAQEADVGADADADAPYVRVLVIPEMKVYVAPMKTGTEEEQQFFISNFKMELAGARYGVAETMEESQYYISMEISRLEDDPDYKNEVILSLFNTLSGQSIVSYTWPFNELTDMYAWNLYLIYQAMANAPTVKMLPDAELIGAPEGNWGLVAEPEPHKPALYAGLKATGGVGMYTIQTVFDYEGGESRSFSGEGAVLLELHLWRHFSLQVEAALLYDTFGDGRQREGETRTVGIFSTLSFWFPLFIKVPVSFGGVSLSPFIGAYYILPLGPISAQFGEETARYSYRVDPPVGISLGIDLGLSWGPGKFIMGLRYDQDLGTTVGETTETPVYSRKRLGLSLGYAWGGGT